MKALAPGKLILSGEHSVVYGEPALAMAIDRSVISTVTPQSKTGISFDLPDIGEQSESFTLLALQDFKERVIKNYRQFQAGNMSVKDVLSKPADLFRFAFINLLDGLHHQLDSGLCLHLQSNIPIGCGLGSSAASVLSELRAIGHYLRVDFKREWYYDFSVENERLQHGYPSGVDSYISLYGGCARFQNGKATSVPLPRIQLYLVQTGKPSTTTGECVSSVREKFAESNIWSEFGSLSDALKDALASNERSKIYNLIRENNRLLTAIGVVPKKVQNFISAVEKAGGAAKICGAGAVSGDAGGSVLVVADEMPSELCREYGYDIFPVRGDPLGTRMVR